MARVVTVNDVLDGHVTLDIECLDRIYLNAYVPTLQTSSQVVAFGRAGVGRQAARRDLDGGRPVLAAAALAEHLADPGHLAGRPPAREHRPRGPVPAVDAVAELDAI
jgi:hypothetical protein